jgi:hypothetical protein
LHRTLYDVLEVTPQASLTEVEQAHGLLVRVWHPDRFGTSGRLWKIANERLAEINRAYEILKDPRKRAAYDERLRTETAPPKAGPAAASAPPRTPPKPRPRTSPCQETLPSWPATLRNGLVLMALLSPLCLFALNTLQWHDPYVRVFTQVLVTQAGLCLLLSHALLGRPILDFRWLVVSGLGLLVYNFFHAHTLLPARPWEVATPVEPLEYAVQAACLAGSQYLFAGERYKLTFWWTLVMAASGFAGGSMQEALGRATPVLYYLGAALHSALLAAGLAFYASPGFQNHTA